MRDADTIIRCAKCCVDPKPMCQDCEYTNAHIGNFCTGYIDIINDLISLLKMQWIPVSDHLPDEGKRVFVYGEHKVYGKEVTHKKNITTGYVRGNTFHADWPISFRVIAWMDVPWPEGGE